jgi:hypothetical protein
VLNGLPVLARILGGVAAGLGFHPIFAAVSAAIAAGVSGYRRAPRSRVWWSLAVLLSGWALGEGIGVAASHGGTAYLAVWAVTGFAVGYASPAFAGGYVGRQVHKGTGYLSAGAVAIMLVSAFAALSAPIAAALLKVAS